jgi:hypothetical protein
MRRAHADRTAAGTLQFAHPKPIDFRFGSSVLQKLDFFAVGVCP